MSAVTTKKKSKRRCGRPKTSTVKTYSRKEPKRNIVRDPFSSEDVIQFPVDTSDALTDTTGVRSKSHVSHLVSRSNLALATHNGTSFMIDAPLPSKIEPSLLDDATATRAHGGYNGKHLTDTVGSESSNSDSSDSFLQPAASKAIFLSNDSDSPPPIERVRAGPIVSAVGRIDDFLSEDIPDFVQNMVRAKPGKRGSTGIEASRPSLGTRRSLKSMDLTGRGSDDSTPSLLHRFKKGLGEPTNIDSQPDVSIEMASRLVNESSPHFQNDQTSNRQRVTGTSQHLYRDGQPHSVQQPASRISIGSHASALVTPRQQPSATTTELCHTFMDASTQTPMAPGVKPVVLVPKTLNKRSPAQLPAAMRKRLVFAASTPASSQIQLDPMPVEASLIQPSIQPVLCSTCRSTFIADHLPAPAVSPVASRKWNSDLPVPERVGSRDMNDLDEAIGEPIMTSTRAPSEACDCTMNKENTGNHSNNTNSNKTTKRSRASSSSTIQLLEGRFNQQPLKSSTRNELLEDCSVHTDHTTDEPPACDASPGCVISPALLVSPEELQIGDQSGPAECEPSYHGSPIEVPVECESHSDVSKQHGKKRQKKRKSASLTLVKKKTPRNRASTPKGTQADSPVRSFTEKMPSPLATGTTIDETPQRRTASRKKAQKVHQIRHIGIEETDELCPFLEMCEERPILGYHYPHTRRQIPLPLDAVRFYL